MTIIKIGKEGGNSSFKEILDTYVNEAPALIFEILSPSSIMKDKISKI